MSTYFRSAPQLITGSSSVNVGSNVVDGSTTVYSVAANTAAIVEIHTVISTTTRFPSFLSLTTDANIALNNILTVPSVGASYSGIVDDGRPVYEVVKLGNGRIGHAMGNVATNTVNPNSSMNTLNGAQNFVSSSPSQYGSGMQFHTQAMFGPGESARLTAWFRNTSGTGTISFSYRIWLFGG